MNKITKIIISTLSAVLIFAANASAQKLSFSKTTIDVGSTLWKKPVTATFNFTNKDSRTPVTIKNVETSCGCMNVEWTKSPIPKGGKGKIKVTYDAQQLGHFNKIIEITTNEKTAPYLISLKGIVSVSDKEAIEKLYPYRIDNVCLSTNNIEFSDVHKGDSVSTTIEILNDGSEVYTPILMHLPEYITAKAKPESLARGRRGKITLTVHGDKVPNLGLNQTSIYVARYSGDRVGTNNDITVSTVLLPSKENMSPNSKTPVFKTSTTEIQLGKIGKKSKLKGIVEIANKGNAPLLLKNIQSFNQAVSISIPKRELAPGETIKVKVVLEAKYLGMSKAMPRILLITNDPNHPKEIINVNFEK